MRFSQISLNQTPARGDFTRFSATKLLTSGLTPTRSRTKECWSERIVGDLSPGVFLISGVMLRGPDAKKALSLHRSQSAYYGVYSRLYGKTHKLVDDKPAQLKLAAAWSRWEAASIKFRLHFLKKAHKAVERLTGRLVYSDSHYDQWHAVKKRLEQVIFQKESTRRRILKAPLREYRAFQER